MKRIGMFKWLKEHPAELIAGLALIISLYTWFFTYQQTERLIAIETNLSHDVRATVVPNVPVRVLPIDNYTRMNSLVTESVIAVWVQVTVTNNGVRTFSIEQLFKGIQITFASREDYGKNQAQEYGDFGFPELEKIYTLSNEPIDFPIAVEPGHQVRLLTQLVMPASEEVATRVDEDESYATNSSLVLVNVLESVERLPDLWTMHDAELPLWVGVRITGQEREGFLGTRTRVSLWEP